MSGEGAQTELRNLGYIDFHTHIMPKMDDGSASVEMSLQMIRMSAEQGVRAVVLTPHFYATSHYPDSFLEKRQRRLELLKESLGDECPLIIPGAEVQYFEGLATMQDLPKMRIGDTKALLIEMPFFKWTERMVYDILEINSRAKFRVVLAHIERYLPFVKEETLRNLVREGVTMQSNASFFSGFTRRKAIRMFKDGLIHLIGSDCHNVTSRPPNIGGAISYISGKLSPTAADEITLRGAHLLGLDPGQLVLRQKEIMT